MALHRDIYWVGRQWAVTGYGMQAADQKQKSKFDIEASRLWEDGLLESLSAEAWFNSEDFSKGLAIARERYPEPPRKTAPPEQSVSRAQNGHPVDPPKPELNIEQPKPLALKFDMRVRGWPAKFTPLWRVSVRR
jgi:hypothetical protein